MFERVHVHVFRAGLDHHSSRRRPDDIGVLILTSSGLDVLQRPGLKPRRPECHLVCVSRLMGSPRSQLYSQAVVFNREVRQVVFADEGKG